MNELKKADTDHPIHDFIARRWSPYVFDGRSISDADLLSLFEAARWAPSSFNEQPWRFIVAKRDEPHEFERLLSCLVEANRVWAKDASALALGVIHLEFTRNGKPNKTAAHDLGLASATLTVEATARGLSVHQMGGILPEHARQLYSIPEAYEAFTGLAIGYPGTPVGELGEHDSSPRIRRPLGEFLFAGAFGLPFGSAD